MSASSSPPACNCPEAGWPKGYSTKSRDNNEGTVCFDTVNGSPARLGRRLSAIRSGVALVLSAAPGIAGDVTFTYPAGVRLAQAPATITGFHLPTANAAVRPKHRFGPSAMVYLEPTRTRCGVPWQMGQTRVMVAGACARPEPAGKVKVTSPAISGRADKTKAIRIRMQKAADPARARRSALTGVKTDCCLRCCRRFLASEATFGHPGLRELQAEARNWPTSARLQRLSYPNRARLGCPGPRPEAGG